MASQVARVVLKMIRVSPRKLNLVAKKIRGMNVSEALGFLSFCQKRIARDVHKAVVSVIANAENNHGLDIDRLYIKESYVGQGIRLRRSRARAKGRGSVIHKPFSRLNIKVEVKED